MRKSIFILYALIFLMKVAVAQSFTLTSPNGGENWPAGSTQNVTWTYSGIPDTAFIKLVLFKDGNKIGNIVQNVSIRAGSYGWRVGDHEEGAAAAGGGYRIRIRDMNGTYPLDESNNPFTIASSSERPDFETTYIYWEGRLKAEVRNHGANYSGPFAFQLTYPQIGYSKRFIFPSMPLNRNETKTFFLEPSWPADKDCLNLELTVDPASQVAEANESNNVYKGKICTDSHPRLISVTSPSGDLIVGNKYTIMWTCAPNVPPGGSVKIHLLDNNQPVYEISPGTFNNGTFFWEVPAALSPGTYIMRVCTLDETVEDLHSVRIISPTGSINVLAPGLGSDWFINQNYIISWKKTGKLDETVLIRLKKGGSRFIDVSTGTTNDGLYEWWVPGVAEGTDYSIEIETRDHRVRAESSLFELRMPQQHAYITVDSPSSGARWRTGDTRSITWRKTGSTGDTVMILLSQGGIGDEFIARETPNTGLYSWTIPDRTLPGEYYISVRVSGAQWVRGQSGIFTILSNQSPLQPDLRLDSRFKIGKFYGKEVIDGDMIVLTPEDAQGYTGQGCPFFSFQFTIHNDSDIPVSGFNAQILFDGVVVSSPSNINVDARGSRTVSTDLGARKGAGMVTIRLDPANVVAEAKENNNNAIFMIRLQGYDTPCTRQ